MDATDRRILQVLQRSPDLALAALAQKVGLSQTPCWRRIKKLEEDGVIQKRALILNPQSLGLAVTVFASVRLKQHDEQTLEALENAARQHPKILECHSMSGEADYVFRVVCRDIDDYEQFLKKVLLHLPGVAAVNSSFVLKQVKKTTDLPI
jgi:Lrp/AsnC family transcriptional regulator